MPIQVFGSDATVSYLNRAFSDVAEANIIYKNQVAFATKNGDTAFANAFAASWSGLTNAELSKKVLTNMGVLPSTEPSVQALEPALIDYFTAFGSTTSTNGMVTSDTRGLIVLQLAKILSTLETTNGTQAVYNKAASAWNTKVDASYTYSSNTANTTATTPGAPVYGNSYSLTIGTDTLAGDANSNIFNAPGTATGDTLSASDSLDGGAGDDTLTASLNSASSLPSGLVIKGIENVNLNVAAATSTFTIDQSAYADVTNLKVVNSSSTGASTTTVNNASGNVSVTSNGLPNTTTSITTTILGDKVVSATVKGGLVAIENAATKDGTAASTLKTVVLENLNATPVTTHLASTIKGAGVDTLTWKNQTTAQAVTITNGTSTSLTLNVDGVGYDTATPSTVVADTVNLGAKTESITINATGAKSAVTVANSAAVGASTIKTVTITGSAALAPTLPATTTTVDGSAATGDITLASALDTKVAVSVKTGSGKDKVTLASTLADKSTINLGSGDDTFLLGAGGLTGTANVIDGGAGIDTVGLSAIGGSYDAAQFKNFELIDISTSGTVDAAVVTGITGLVLSSLSNALTATVNNLATTAGLTVTNQTSSVSSVNNNTNLKVNSSGSADAFTVTFAGTSTASGVTGDAGKLTVDGIELFNVVSGGTSGNVLNLTDSTLQKLTITGAKDLSLSFTSSTGASGAPTGTLSGTTGGVSLIDGSAATGKLTIDTSVNSGGNNNNQNFVVAKAGLTIKGGTAADTITGTAKADTIIGGGGADVITGGAGGDKITISGGVSTINIAASGDTGNNNSSNTEVALLTGQLDVITGVKAGDKIALGSASAGTSAAGIFATPTTDLITSATLATNLAGADNTVLFARGIYDATNNIFNFNPTGSDSVMTYDYNGAANAAGSITNQDFHSIILVGYVPATAAAATGSTSTAAATITLA